MYTKFYNSDDVNMIAAKLLLTKTRPHQYKRQSVLRNNANRCK